ncbi:bifunctional diguanylate cyclase/phosphodiesterase [Planomicrobium sp. CPCC 101079]|uniref:sensor domain-containing protein n=1 Tax=Planomicrobium sp. CPCC 101079 TaxID=2599618 RepID=UPI0011B59F72|nr:bifunctional diguanylate cyclase/phosphodiesterase [Planomicrobium sp. CPCC 101079]TWT03661.1 EAL domain-containing protein [Planomicrobium sp. CPCC 101079]
MKQQINISTEWFNVAKDPLIIIDNKGKIVEVNQAWTDLCAEYDLVKDWCSIGADYFKLIRQTGGQREIQAILNVINKEILTYEKKQTLPSTNGELVPFSVNVIPLNSESSVANYALLSHQPIPVHSIEAITAESVLESMTEGFFLTDDQFNLIYLNDVAERMLCCKRAEVIGRNVWDSFPDAKTIKPLYEAYERAAIEKVEAEIETFYEPLASWFRLKAYPLANNGLAIYIQDVGERKKAEITLTQYAYFDDLTGLPNRRSLIKEGASLKGQDKFFSLYFINLDNLKLINTLHDYSTGNQILKMAADKLRELAGAQHKVGRRDGDNFVFIRCFADKSTPSQFAEKILALFDRPFDLDNFKSIKVSASVGIAHFPEDAETLEILVANAETAMFEAKKVKGSSYAVFNAEMNNRRNRKLVIEEGLTKKLSDSGFYFTLQPQIDGMTGELTGAEVLSRWNHPTLGELSPLEFIEVAEQSGTIIALTQHLLTEVFTKMKEWESRYGRSIKTAINMTPSLLCCSVFVDTFIQLMEQYGIQPEWIEIEITEQAEITYSDKTLANLMRCKEYGISIAIDDFGTGFSMISYLTQFPVNKIKIDKCFIQKIGEDQKSEALLQSLIHLVKSIGCELLAEGVERQEEVRFLKNNGCTIFQGYLFDKPLKAEDFEAKFLRGNYKYPIGE